MRTRPRPNRQLKTVNSVFALLRNKKPKRLVPKKIVRFNLMTKSSSSEIMLSSSRPMDSLMKPAGEQGLELKSQSCVNIATPNVFSRLSYPRTFSISESPFEIQSPNHLKYCKIRNLQKYIQCFNDLYLLGPILNLQKKIPTNGILKNVRTSLISYRNNEDNMSVKEQLLTLANMKDTNKCFSSNSSSTCAQPVSVCESGSNYENTEVNNDVQHNILDSIATSIQKLHISSHSQGDQCHKDITATTGQSSMSFLRFVPQNISKSQTHHKPASWGYTCSCYAAPISTSISPNLVSE